MDPSDARIDTDGGLSPSTVHDTAPETRLLDLLHVDPNDVATFTALVELIRRRAAEGHGGIAPASPGDSAVWALAEEIAHDQRAWYPLIELARLSVDEDRDSALRRLGVAAERDPSGQALLEGLLLLRRAGMPEAALGLGVGHWRPRQHPVEVGRQLVEAAIDAGRFGEARRHLRALAAHPDTAGVDRVNESASPLLDATDPAG